MNRDLTPAERDQLESLVDSACISAVLQSLSEICGDKADHLQGNWQDHGSAHHWNTAAGIIGIASTNVDKRLDL